MSPPTAPAAADAQARALAQAGLDHLEGAWAFGGGADLVKPGLGSRRRTRVELAGPGGQVFVCFLKRYGPESPWRRLAALLTGRGGVAAAKRERDVAAALEAAGVPSVRVLAFGQRGRLLGARRSYVVLAAVPGESLERCGGAFFARHGMGSPAAEALTRALADLAARLHAAGWVHRDLYACHVFLDEPPQGPPALRLIDLARVMRPRWRGFRWRVKDLAQLKFSMPASWVGAHWEAFVDLYLRATGDARGRGRWHRAIDRKVGSMRRRQERRQ